MAGEREEDEELDEEYLDEEYEEDEELDEEYLDEEYEEDEEDEELDEEYDEDFPNAGKFEEDQGELYVSIDPPEV